MPAYTLSFQPERSIMKIQSINKEELAILILSLRALPLTNYESSLARLRDKLRRQLEKELRIRYDVVIKKEHTTNPRVS